MLRADIPHTSLVST